MTVTPERIQRKRTKGWRMPEGAVYVGRPSKWGNPITPENTIGCDSPADAATRRDRSPIWKRWWMT